MSMMAPGAVASRRAALLVHAMPPSDQAWLLGSLPPAQREAVEELLGELREMGIPPDAALLRDVIEAPPTAQPETAEDVLARLDAHQVERLAQLLRDEPPVLAGRVLALRAWPWAGALLAQLPEAAAEAAARHAARPRAPALERALCEALLRRLDSTVPVRGRHGSPKWRALLARLAVRRRAR
ncbi:hypothetical protein [Ramlibacter pallidus]|uniref:Magnesium transporter MgtE intracellular domain-containing protein n=1 Tax=Ramlibacter pallidus TaxID=2780087 RepID=A0ABR9S118_9BURK|nr:hypothetical protein [Ramlibacter pallidus]MBE7367193.1 hypothetical protein [Ramlibacter pallidus]